MNCSSLMRIPLVAFASAFATEASAQYNLRTIPVTPSAGRPFSVVFDDSPCDEFVPAPPGLPPTFEVNGSQVRLAVDLLDLPNCDSESTTFTIPVPGLPQGDYSLLLIGRALQSPNNYGELETVPLTIGPPVARAPTRIPAAGLEMLLLLGTAMMAIGVWIARCRRGGGRAR